MKFLVLLLIALNIGIFVYGQKNKDVVITNGRANNTPVGEIRILSDPMKASTLINESNDSKITKEGLEEPIASQDIKEDDLNDTDTRVILTDDKQQTKTVAEEIVDKSADEDSLTSNVIEDNSGNAGAESDQETVSGRDVVSKSLVGPIEDPEVIDQISNTICGSLGPLSNSEESKKIIRDLISNGMTAELREEQQEVITGYWVLIPPMKSQQAAIAIESKLKRRGVVDLRRFYRGEFKNGISLGIYTRRWNAEKRQKTITEKGFSPVVLPRKKMRDVFTIDYRSSLGRSSTNYILRKFENVEVVESRCH